MKIALIGYGKMGRAIEQVALSKGHAIACKFTRQNSRNITPVNLRTAEVAIEFTQPDAAYQNVLRCFEAGIPVVSGTTGWTVQLDEAKRICAEKKQAFFHAPNFSIGVNLFFALNEFLATMINRFPQYDRISISETHHIHKKDAPSGTAVALAADLIQRIGRLNQWESLAGDTRNRKNPDDGLLPIHSFRVGDVPGQHEVTYECDDDLIRLSHEAKGRTGFANGAVAAAEWIVGKKGVFGMKDLLQL